MARTIQQGMLYFNLDVDFLQNIKVRRILRSCGPQAIIVLIWLLSSIYRDDGYYVQWHEDMPFLIADDVGINEGAVEEIVKKAIQVGFFSAEMYEAYNILTSRGLQQRFFEMACRRKAVNYDERYLLIDINEYSNAINVNRGSVIKVDNNTINANGNSAINVDIMLQNVDKNPINVDKNPINVDIMKHNVDKNQQSKVKESKVKESKVKNKQQLYINLNMEEAIKVYQDNIHPITSSIEKENLIDLIETHGTKHVQQAIEEAVIHNARNLKYVAAVLEAWQAKGYQLANKQNPKVITSDDSEKSQSYIEFMERRKAHKAAQKGGQMGHADRRSDELHKGSARGDIRDTNTADGPREIKKILEDI